MRVASVLMSAFKNLQHEALQGDEGNHLDLRQRVVDFIEQHPDDFAPYMEDDEDFESYCRRMRKVGHLHATRSHQVTEVKSDC